MTEGTSQRYWKNKYLLLAGAIVAVIIIAVLLLSCICSWRRVDDIPSFDDIPFDKEQWLAQESNPSSRGRMIHDLRRHHLNPGMGTDAIVAVLGQPYRILHRSDYTFPPMNGYTYWWYALERNDCFDVHALVIVFDAQDKYIGSYDYCK